MKTFTVNNREDEWSLIGHILNDEHIDTLVLNTKDFYFYPFHFIYSERKSISFRQKIESLKEFNIDTIDCSNLDSVSRLFKGFHSLTKIPKLINTGNINNCSGMFLECENLKPIPLFDTHSVTNFSQMFSKCYNLETIPLFNTENALDMDYMFNECENLKVVPKLNTKNVVSAKKMFNECHILETVPDFDFTSVVSITGIFSGCISLGEIPNFKINKENIYKDVLFGKI